MLLSNLVLMCIWRALVLGPYVQLQGLSQWYLVLTLGGYILKLTLLNFPKFMKKKFNEVLLSASETELKFPCNLPSIHSSHHTVFLMLSRIASFNETGPFLSL